MAACTADSMNRQFICEFLGLLTDSAFTSGSLQPAGSVSLWLPLALDSLPTHSQPQPQPQRQPQPWAKPHVHLLLLCYPVLGRKVHLPSGGTKYGL